MMTKTNKGHDYSTLLIWAAILVTVVRYSGAFLASDLGQITGWVSDILTVFMGISGLGMGILDVLGGAYLFDGLRRSMPANGKAWPMRFKLLFGMVVLLIGSGVMILVPFTMSRVMHANMDIVLGTGTWLFAWSLLVNITPYLLIGGVAISSQVVMVNSKPSEEVTENMSVSDGKVTGNFPANWRQIKKKLSVEDVTWLKSAKTEEICFRWGVDDRTARNWRKYAQEEKAKESVK